MQRSAVLLAAAACLARTAVGLKFVQVADPQAPKESPVTQVVQLLTQLKTNIESDGTAEQSAYDKYACWCEDTLAQKAQDISNEKQAIEDLQESIVKFKSEIASHGAEIKQAEKDITANLESQKEAEDVRRKQSEGYEEEKLESEQCVGALEAAIKVLSGAGEKKGGKGFLETLQEAQLLSVVAGVKGLLARPAAERAVNQQDMLVVRHFVDKPEDFVGARAGMLSAAQIANNPFGDYAPQSTQIQGILKSMYDSFVADLEKANSEEGGKQKAFEDLMVTKKAEFETLQATLGQHQKDEAAKTKSVSDDKISLDDTNKQLEADEAFFAQTKDTCRTRASEWATRTRLRTEELHGIVQAIAVLSSDEAKKTFSNASNTFLQLGSARHHSFERDSAYEHLRKVAGNYHSLRLAKIAVAVRTTGHFDKIMQTIDNMVEVLRREEQQDIEDKKWCEAKQYKNKIDMEDLNHAITKANTTIGRHEETIGELDTKLDALKVDINKTETDIGELRDMRIEESQAFIQAVKDDTDAIALIEQAIVHLTKFYKNQGIPLALLAEKRNATDAPPELGWKAGYDGRKGEHEGIVAILTMIKEDLQNEIKTGRSDDADAQVRYEKDMQALRDTLKAQTDSEIQVTKQKAELGATIADLEELRGLKETDLDAEGKKEEALGVNCAWVESHFETRRTKRKAEIQGLQDAKSYLAGVEAGTELGN